ncbi:T9SS type A sorting domain-containing protein [Mangrovibacterium sp.]|uniref:T9SS type A sorting domain-containing protein n=1 Tax=Mangrovibacterium sp. TaxID=1961364 RepID=UPI003565AC80
MKASYLIIVLVLACLIGSAQAEISPNVEQAATKVERVYPNPLSDYLFVEIKCVDYAQATIVLLDILGNPVQQWENVEVVPGTQKVRLDLKLLHSGIYLLKVTIGDQKFVNRLRKV